jgi:hypothetical protein
MFNWFKKPDYSNVVKFPEQIKVPSMPYVAPPAEEKEQEYYSIGITSEDRMTFKIGYSTLTMNRQGVEHLIEQLEVFMNQLPQESKEEDGQPN